MIVRILGEGQWELAPSWLPRLNELDATVGAAMEDSDQDALAEALTALRDHVWTHGKPVPDDAILDSDLILPDNTVTLDEMRRWLSGYASPEQGLIPD